MRQLVFPWLQGGNAGGFHNNYVSSRYLRAPALNHRFPLLDMRILLCSATMHQKRQSAEECAEEGREERGLGSSVELNVKGTKQNGKNPEWMEITKVYRSKCGEIWR